ncbi:NDP-sugar synthase [bacterium]|nr:NDP-sugar synthase [bacterium]
MLKKAMIMSAGIGTRLEPLTLSVPKPMIPLCNVPVMDFSLLHLSNNGIKDVIANVYYLSEQITERYSKKNKYGINFTYIKEEVLSGTAGGVKKCQSFFDKNDDFLVLSGDGLTDFELKEAYEAHKKSDAIVTIIVKEIDKTEVSKYGVIVTDENNLVKHFQEKPKQEEALSTLINTGIYIFKYDIFNIIPANTFFDFAKDVFPRLMETGYKINTFKTNRYWSDIGSLSQYKNSNDDVLKGAVSTSHQLIGDIENNYISASEINDAEITGCCSIGKNCIFGRNVKIENSILWDNIIVNDGVTIKDSIIASNNIVTENIERAVVGAGTEYRVLT